MRRLQRNVSRVRLGLALCLASTILIAAGRPALAQTPEESPAPDTGLVPDEQEGTPAAEDPTRTAGGALRLFMASRHYQTIRQLRGVMTERLQARFDHDSAPFNGKRGNRLAGFDFAEKDLKPARTAGKQVTPASSYIASVRSLWEEQGEASERRTEAITLVLQDSGLWRVADLAIGATEKLRFADAVNGVTALRMVLRAWIRGDAAAARQGMSPALLKKLDEDALRALFTPATGRGHVAYQIVDMTPQGTTGAVARVRLYETVTGEPGSIDGQPRTLRMVKKGSRWLVDGWD
ncbi:MAG TPA: hypothetical protein VEW47_05670 [Candidatus Dormibacteraeota bacterium]|nr:hypothetical protein [Candidatus Dormibacteraeota bacterium]